MAAYIPLIEHFEVEAMFNRRMGKLMDEICGKDLAPHLRRAFQDDVELHFYGAIEDCMGLAKHRQCCKLAMPDSDESKYHPLHAFNLRASNREDPWQRVLSTERDSGVMFECDHDAPESEGVTSESFLDGEYITHFTPEARGVESEETHQHLSASLKLSHDLIRNTKQQITQLQANAVDQRVQLKDMNTELKGKFNSKQNK